MPTARAVAGFTLVEVMIAVLVLALGIVGGVSMQLAALRARHQSTLLAQASWLAVGMAERMRANPEQMRLPDGANLYLTLDYDVLAEPNPPAPAALCYGGDCNGAQLAAFDLYEMKALMRENLPAGRAVICRDAGLWSGGKLRWPCSGGAGAPLVVKVGWRGKNPDGTPRKDEAGEYVPGVALPLGLTVGGAMIRAREQGWTIIELVIATGLGLVLTLLASALLLATSSGYRNHSENTWIDDGGRYALEIMSQAIRQGAYVNWDSKEAPAELAEHEPAAIAGLDASSISKASDGISGVEPDVANGSDVLALRFSGHGDGANGDGSSLNCAGFGVGAPSAVIERGWSIFYVAADAGGEPELRCKYRSAAGWGADAIVRGVDSFQVLYGLDSDDPADGIPNTFVNATAINGMDAGLALVGATPEELQRDLHRKTHWKRVCSVKLALLLHGENNTRADTVVRRFDLFGPAYSEGHGDDRGVRIGEGIFPESQRWRARRVFGMTVALRNRSG